ncbi:hypothetical protein [Jannaschia formosa]|uniref:hypothetical protein n=1 Tax=Jannaschia formosa TaxID=2259592 RepID=UPI000E1BE336|nr:hypothetical protein [Jannaschia formosa]TFL18521.1 hypothetical protein DR046_08565 [Jannaschia formosa]
MPDPARSEDPAARDYPVLRKWYFCANEGALRGDNFKLLRAAIQSCLRHTDLQPHCLYVGGKAPALRVMRDLGVTVIRHAPSLEPWLRPAYGPDYETFAGHWLRIDIPRIETEDDHVLYTDIDVLFRPLPALIDGPELLAVAPERWRTRAEPFNSGVMLMHLPGLRAVDDAFRAAIRARLQGDFTWPTHDQASFNAFFRGRTDPLPLSMNWKPYWGRNDAAHIVHFHGPKPRMAAKLAAGEARGLDAGQARLHGLAPAAYRHYGALFRAELREPAGQRPARSTRIRPRSEVPPPGAADRLATSVGARRAWAGDIARAVLGRLRETRPQRGS